LREEAEHIWLRLQHDTSFELIVLDPAVKGQRASALPDCLTETTQHMNQWQWLRFMMGRELKQCGGHATVAVRDGRGGVTATLSNGTFCLLRGEQGDSSEILYPVQRLGWVMEVGWVKTANLKYV